MAQCWVNGQLVDENTATISLHDTGLLHGAGVFTTMRAYSGVVFRIEDHLRRLRSSCEALMIPLTWKDEDLVAASDQLLKANGLGDARLRLTVTRGRMIHDADQVRLQPAAFLTAVPLQPYPKEHYEKGITAIVYDRFKLNPFDILAGHKALNYVGQFAALNAARQVGAAEAFWFNVHNFLQEGSISNIFIVRSGTLYTPPTPVDLEDQVIADRTPYSRSNVLPGVARKTVIEIAQRQNIPIIVGPLTINDLLSADECFVTNSIMEVMPVCRIERKALGKEQPGDLTRRMGMLYRISVESYVRGDSGSPSLQ